MPLVLLKNFLFPRGSETQPLLPTTYLATDQAIAKPPLDISLPPSNYCSRKDCPKYPRRDSECSEASSTTATDTPSSSSSRNSKHWFDARTISDAIIGLSDGLTVPFALTAGLSAFNDTRVVIFGGCAELIAGSISMGLGGWLAGRGEAEFYNTTLHETRALVANSPQEVPDMIYAVFSPYRVPDTAITPLVDSLTKDPVATVDFLMCFHHSLPAASSTKRTPFSSALTIAAGYFLGGFIPLLPYWFVDRDQVMMGLYWSVGVMSVCLFIFGVGRNIAVGEGTGGLLGRFRGGMEMVAIGGVAAAASWGIVKALGDGHN